MASSPAQPGELQTGPALGDPYCGACGYSLVGATESARCPECGRPLVETLRRRTDGPAVRRIRYTSPATLFGMPAIHIALGPDFAKGEQFGRARGFLAIGDTATGGVALGGKAVGVVSIGGFSVGVFSLGGCSIGACTAAGGCALALGAATGGLSIGSLALGGMTIGAVAKGGMAIGYAAQGGAAVGAHTISPRTGDSPVARQIFDEQAWFFGVPQTTPAPRPLLPSVGFSQPLFFTIALPLLLSIVFVLVALLSTRGPGRRGGAATMGPPV